MDGPNNVYAWKSDDDYPGISYINNRKPGELYIVGGEYPTLDDPNMVGPFVAKADATTGKQIWRTYLDNLNASGHWIGNANLNILDNGNIAFAWSNQIVLIDGDTGLILKHNTLPSRRGARRGRELQASDDCARPHAHPQGPDTPDRLHAAGHDGDHQVRRRKGMKQPNSVLVAVDPDTLEVLDAIPLPEPSSVPHAITMFEGKIAIYIGMNESARRVLLGPGDEETLGRTSPGSSIRCRRARRRRPPRA